MIAAAAILLVAWLADRYAIPIWHRYRYYQLQERIAHYANPSNAALVHFSATQPYAHVPGPVDQFYNSFWSERAKLAISSMTFGPLPGGPATPVFCGTLKTPGGQTRVVQIFATSGQVYATGMKLTGSGGAIALIAVSCELQSPRWIISGSRRYGGEDISFGSIRFALNPPYDVSVSSGTVNASDPSEVDVNFTVNGRTDVFQLHVVDLPPTPRPNCVGFASDYAWQSAIPWARFGGSSGIWNWPFTGK